MRPTSLGSAFLQTCRLQGYRNALLHKKGGVYRAISYRELGESVLALSAQLLHLGIKPGDRIALLSNNRPEWAQVDFAALSLGAVIVPIYPSLSATQVKFILEDSGAHLLFAENPAQAIKAAELLQNGTLRGIWVFDKDNSGYGEFQNFSVLVQDARERSASAKNEALQRLREVNRRHLATLIYTSGTTGRPKGVMLTHGNFLANMNSILQVLDIGPGDVMLSLLPLSHVFERCCGHFIPLCMGATVAYAESPNTVAQNLLEVKPTIVIAVPRLYEKMQARILEAVDKGPWLRRKIFHWAIEIGHRVAQQQPGSLFDFWLSIRYLLADKLVFSKIRERTGGRLRFFVSGGAALPLKTAEFFQAAGLLILEGYGLTESSPVLTVNCPEARRLGTVGRSLPGVEIKIAEDGEILARGDNIMQGYYNLPQETKAALPEDGFLRTGDIGYLDKDGFLIITDRKKNLIITSGGRNIAPTPLENLLKSSRYVSEVMIIGDNRHFLSALIVPDFEQIRAYAQRHDMRPVDDQALTHNPKIHELIEAEIERLFAQQAPYEQIRKFTLLPREFSIAQNEMTPTLKIKRRVVTEKFLELIEKMYE